MAGAEFTGDIVEILHRDDVDPRLRHRDHDLAAAEAEREEKRGAGLEAGHRLLDLVAAGDTEMDDPGADLAGDFGRREEGDLDSGHALDAGTVAPVRARLHHFEPGGGEAGVGIGLQPSLGRDRDDQRRTHERAPMRSSQIEKPTAGTVTAVSWRSLASSDTRWS